MTAASRFPGFALRRTPQRAVNAVTRAGAGDALRLGMVRLVLLLSLFAGCSSSGHETCPDQPPWRGGSVECDEVGDTCAYADWSCTCDSSGKFYCSSCPTTACTPGSSCSYSNWE